MFGRRPLRRRLAFGMPVLPTAPEQGLPEPSAPRPPTGFVLGLDMGSSMIRCHVYDRAGRVRGSSAQKVTGSGRRAVVRVAKASGRVRLFLPSGGHLQPGPRSRGARGGLCSPSGQAAARAPFLSVPLRPERPRWRWAPRTAHGSWHLGIRRSGLSWVGLQGPGMGGPLQSPLVFSCTSLIVLQPHLRLYFKIPNLDRF